VDDLRESPAFDIVKKLKEENIGELLVCEPNLDAHDEFDLIALEEVLARADIILLLVDHRKFKSLKASELNEKVLIDTRGIIR
jgi:UDP-N-acetyl-D-mannosaminuronic acid dehydrogenase